MRRAAISIPSNIAEGQSRNSTKEFMYFISIAKGSKSELETQLLVCKNLNYLDDKEIEKAFGLVNEVGKMLSVLGKRLTTSH
ncbi:MAG: four helix bundle protein [Oscillospiraceae bacterium]|nr:four helix bundle protein [Oscillospiraceae bacterium]